MMEKFGFLVDLRFLSGVIITESNYQQSSCFQKTHVNAITQNACPNIQLLRRKCVGWYHINNDRYDYTPRSSAAQRQMLQK